MRPLYEIYDAFYALKDYCAEIDTNCDGCIFADEKGCCIFGTMAPWEWQMPVKDGDNDG